MKLVLSVPVTLNNWRNKFLLKYKSTNKYSNRLNNKTYNRNNQNNHHIQSLSHFHKNIHPLEIKTNSIDIGKTVNK